MIHCKNCGINFNSNYCPNCGQKNSVSNLTLKEVIHEFWHGITHTDKGILNLIKSLFFTPKEVYFGYFSGQRKKYFSPVTFFLIATSLYIFLKIRIFDFQDYLFNYGDEMGRLLIETTKFKSIYLIPLEVLITWLVFKNNSNLAKIIVFWLFLNGFLFCIEILATPIFFIFIHQKIMVDKIFYFICLSISFWHLKLVFTSNKWLDYIKLIVIINLVFILDYLISGYLLFGENIMTYTKSSSFLELLLNSYKSIF